VDLRLTFNEDVANYDKLRPTYVKELFDDIIAYSRLNSEKSALEIGIGTGQATQPFLDTGCKLTAVELGADMARFAKENFSKFDNFDVINGDFETVDLENNHYDLIYSATAFHWIPQEAGYTKVFNLLKSGGALALFWNHPSYGGDAFYAAMQEVYSRYFPASKVHRFSEKDCAEIVGTIIKYGFVDIGYKLYHQTRSFSALQYMSLLNTYSDHRATEEKTRVMVETELSNVINHFGGKIEIQDTIDLYLARKPNAKFSPGKYIKREYGDSR